VLRTLRGRSMFRGSNDHLALRLRQMGLSVKQTVLALWGISAFLALCSGWLVRLTEKRAFAFLLGLSALGMVFTLIIASVSMTDPRPGERARVAGAPRRGDPDEPARENLPPVRKRSRPSRRPKLKK